MLQLSAIPKDYSIDNIFCPAHEALRPSEQQIPTSLEHSDYAPLEDNAKEC